MPAPPPEAAATVEFRGVGRPFYYPDGGNVADHLQRIVSGNEYPLIPMPSFRPAVVIDIGANVGATALYFLDAYPAAARVLCFEPAATNVGYLRRNTAGLAGVEIFPYGLYSKTVTAPLYEGASQCMQHSIYPGPEVTDRSTAVELRCAFDELAPVAEAPWMLKIDVEGAEVAILRSLRPLFGRIGVIYLEYHSERERLEFDRLLSPGFMLWWSSAGMIHRGNVAYVSKGLLGPEARTMGEIVAADEGPA